MREIIFRGKSISSGEWVEGFLLVGTDCIYPGRAFICEKMYAAFCDSDEDDLMLGGFVEVDPSTVGQYTGLTDKNGNRAFENDITKDQWGRKWIIFGCKGGFGTCIESEWKNNSPIIYNALADAQNAEWFSKQYEIIGTIHDNPELLKEEPT